MDLRLSNLQQQLVDLGYNYTIKVDSVLLVEKLVADLLETTENLQKYMKFAQDAIEERDALKFGAEPYKCDNAKLTQECNELHLTIIGLKENHDREVREFKTTILKLQKDKEELVTSNKLQRQKIRELELDAVRKSSRHSSTNILQGAKSKSTTNICSNKKTKEFDTAMAMTEQKISNLTKEICKLKQHQLELCAINDELQSKLCHREKEIHRLNRLLEGGRPLDALNTDCCFQDINRQMSNKLDEIVALKKSKSELEIRFKEARNKQHEAMKHALHLAERNTQLEKELKDIDEMALVVEKECNNSRKTYDVKVKNLQERLHSTVIELQSLEKEQQTTRIDIQKYKAALDAANIEKRHLQEILDEALEDKKRLNDRINSFTVIEQDLNEEIDRLVQQTAEQTRIIADLKGQLMMQKTRLANMELESGNEQPRRAVPRNKSPPVKGSNQKENKKPSKAASPNRRTAKGKHNSTIPNVPNNTPNTTRPSSEFNEYLDRIKSERDFYVREYKALLEKIRKDNMAERLNYNLNISNSNENRNFIEASRGSGVYNRQNELDFNDADYEKISYSNSMDLREQISNLKQMNQALATEKHNLLARLENSREYSDATEYLTLKATSKRLERERDILKADVDRLEEERDSMKQRLKVSAELHASELERYKKLITEQEEQIKNFEKERYDILQNQGSRRATITNLEDNLGTLREQLKSSNDELIHQKTIYSQLKVLHEQTDRALVDSQNQISHLEEQLSSYQSKQDAFGSKTSSLTKDIQRLKDDISKLTKNLVDVEREKDNLLVNLDEKTENIALLEDQLKMKNTDLEEAKLQASTLRQKVSATLDEKNTKECQLKCKSNDVAQLKRDLEAALMSKENLVHENKRIQDELSSCVLDNRKLQCELEVAKRQINDLKMQLQHYCAEVKRIEDLMAQKEIERSEMLDQFRSLSYEANALESSNHSLESEATQSKLQLSVALDHAGELEQILAKQKGLIKTYEKQISDMTSQIASMEMQLKHHQLQQERSSLEMNTLRELCAKLDKQKDDMNKQLAEKDYRTSKIEQELYQLKRTSERANLTLEKDQDSIRTMENLLSDTRHQLVEQRLINEDLQNEVMKFKTQVTEMQQNLTLANEKLDMYQEKALEYSTQNTRLRREIVNERFSQSKDDTTRQYPSL